MTNPVPKTANRVLCILGPAFIVAAVAEVVFLALFDPIELHLVARVLGLSNHFVWYSIGFLLFWAFAAASSVFSYFILQRVSAGNRRSPRLTKDRKTPVLRAPAR